MPADQPSTPIQVPALCDFAGRWTLDGDYIRCRRCKRPQIVSYALWDFPHASGCRNAAAERNPWKTLASLITAQIAMAKHPEDVKPGDTDGI